MKKIICICVVMILAFTISLLTPGSPQHAQMKTFAREDFEHRSGTVKPPHGLIGSYHEYLIRWPYI